MKSTRYICIEGTEGVGKTTQTKKLVEFLRSKGYSVLETKEPGTPHSPLTMELRNIMLNAKYEPEMTGPARELVSQAIRSIHLEKVVKPAVGEYDFIIQDRGILSGLSYGEACGNDLDWLLMLADSVVTGAIPQLAGRPTTLYTNVVLLTGNVKNGLSKAIAAKQEFEAGDAIEMRGISFMEKVNANMSEYSRWFPTSTINVDGKGIEEVFDDILLSLNIRRDDAERT